MLLVVWIALENIRHPELLPVKNQRLRNPGSSSGPKSERILPSGIKSTGAFDCPESLLISAKALVSLSTSMDS